MNFLIVAPNSFRPLYKTVTALLKTAFIYFYCMCKFEMKMVERVEYKSSEPNLQIFFVILIFLNTFIWFYSVTKFTFLIIRIFQVPQLGSKLSLASSSLFGSPDQRQQRWWKSEKLLFPNNENENKVPHPKSCRTLQFHFFPSNF